MVIPFNSRNPRALISPWRAVRSSLNYALPTLGARTSRRHPTGRQGGQAEATQSLAVAPALPKLRWKQATPHTSHAAAEQ